MSNFPNITDQFEAISLDQINSIKGSLKLLKRHDTKFVFSSDKLGGLLNLLIADYKILQIDGNRIFEYENLYFDTASSAFYRQHHNQKLSRYKFRFRKYVGSGLHYWEVKLKTNKSKTVKDRLKQKSIEIDLSDNIIKFTKELMPEKMKEIPESSIPALYTSFKRVTLAGKERTERITIDIDISYSSLNGQKKDLTGISVAEVKQDRLSSRSPFFKSAKERMIYPSPFSKYCTGIALLNSSVKHNRFKRRLRNLEKLTGGNLKCL